MDYYYYFGVNKGQIKLLLHFDRLNCEGPILELPVLDGSTSFQLR